LRFRSVADPQGAQTAPGRLVFSLVVGTVWNDAGSAQIADPPRPATGAAGAATVRKRAPVFAEAGVGSWFRGSTE